MAITNTLNVFKGPDSLRRYFDPDEQPPLPMVELPEKLNPFRKDGVRIYAKLLTTLPAQNVKALPALNMLLHEASADRKGLIEVSSGSTVTSLSVTARVLYDNPNTTAFVSNKASLDRVRELQFFGLEVALYGGPTYTDTTDLRGPVEWARQRGRGSSSVINLGQYDNEYNFKSHARWTGPQIWKQLPEINIFCMGMGSTGCVTGTGQYLKSQKPSVTVLGVCNAEADLVPGPRELPMHQTSPFPWKDVTDFTETVSSEDSYRVSMRLSREGIISGPSSGMNLHGLFEFLQRTKRDGTLSQYADPTTGEISCVFICCDLPQKHIETYFKKLPAEEFRPIVNEDLFDIDQYPYSFRWEIDPKEPHRQNSEILDWIKEVDLVYGQGDQRNDPSNAAAATKLRIIDLRSSAHFELCHVRNALNLPVRQATESPFDFGDPKVLRTQCEHLASIMKDSATLRFLNESVRPLLILDYNGNTSRILAARLRAQGIEAYTMFDGMPGFLRFHNNLATTHET
ncbi:cysteine synthase b like protein [Zymoseptoria brevis]|uniref:Cysteine synthase b like protein n=1 Tax=Zymoseptoria brevis TaxID=1047168 RepID=A0A0F4GBH0_9PEZI|nr:cysteine synthase b like protein [Zymoseptoria brevis]